MRLRVPWRRQVANMAVPVTRCPTCGLPAIGRPPASAPSRPAQSPPQASRDPALSQGPWMPAQFRAEWWRSCVLSDSRARQWRGRDGKQGSRAGCGHGRRDEGLAKLPRGSVGADGQLRCVPTPSPGCLFTHQCGQLPAERTVTDTKQRPCDMVPQGPCHPLLRTIIAPTPCMSARVWVGTVLGVSQTSLPRGSRWESAGDMTNDPVTSLQSSVGWPLPSHSLGEWPSCQAGCGGQGDTAALPGALSLSLPPACAWGVGLQQGVAGLQGTQ